MISSHITLIINKILHIQEIQYKRFDVKEEEETNKQEFSSKNRMEKLIPLVNKLQEIFYRTKVPFSVEMP